MKKQKRFLIIGSPLSRNNRDLTREIQKRGHFAKIIEQKNLVFKFNGRSENFSVHCKKLNLDSFDIFLFRGYNSNRTEAQMLAERMLFLGKTVIDEIIGKNFIIGKMYEASEFSENGIPHLETFEAMNLSSAKKILSHMNFPVIIKANDSQKGRKVFKLSTRKEALAFLRNNPEKYLIQKYIPIQHDFRIIVVGGKVLGAIKRYVPANDFRTNLANTRAEQAELTKKMKKIAVAATRAMACDVAGIDLLEYRGQLKLIEVNIAPEWQKFKKVTGINPAEEIISLALKRFRRNKIKTAPKRLLGLFCGRIAHSGNNT